MVLQEGEDWAKDDNLKFYVDLFEEQSQKQKYLQTITATPMGMIAQLLLPSQSTNVNPVSSSTVVRRSRGRPKGSKNIVADAVNQRPNIDPVLDIESPMAIDPVADTSNVKRSRGRPKGSKMLMSKPPACNLGWTKNVKTPTVPKLTFSESDESDDSDVPLSNMNPKRRRIVSDEEGVPSPFKSGVSKVFNQLQFNED